MTTQHSAPGRPVRIHIAIPSRNPVGYDLCGELAMSLMKMRQDDRYAVTIRMVGGFGVDIVRNRIVAEFLETDAQFLLMIDDDMVPPDDLLGMADSGNDVVGALYYAWDPRLGPFVAAYDRGTTTPYSRLVIGDAERTGLREVALVGSGCVMCHRRVFEALPTPWFDFETDAARRNILVPEDYLFCRKAAASGFRIFLDTDRICGHIKKVDLRDVAALVAARKRSALFELLE